MIFSTRARLLALSLLPVSLAVFGCGGAMSLPDTVLTSQVSGPAIHGSAYGGHAPIVGMHIYLAQPGTSGYGSAATSLLSGTGTVKNSNDPGVPSSAKYVTTNSAGEFDLTGLYTCTAGEPVYIYGYGGSPTSYTGTYSNSSTTTTPTQEIYTITQIVVSNASPGNTEGGTATYTITISTPVTLTAEQSITIGGLNDNSNLDTVLDGVQTVAAAVTASSTFSVVATNVYASTEYGPTDTPPGGSGEYSPADINYYYYNIGDGTYNETGTGTDISGSFGSAGTFTGTVPVSTTTYTPTTNPIVELATLGNCPDNLTSTTGNFSGGSTALSYIYMNEVSTVATAYTFQPFTSDGQNSAWDIGTPGGSDLTGIENAANTAGQIYDIQGRGGATTTPADDDEGEGHIANLTTPATLGGPPNTGNGTVPQQTVDTLANILAACIDSSVGTDGSLSSACSTLFSKATDDGTSTGTSPTDTAVAAINIARVPGGQDVTGTTHGVNSHTTALFDIQGTIVPYMPDLANAPNDFTLTLAYSGVIGATNGKSPHAVAIDASGNVYAVNSSANEVSIVSPLGTPFSCSPLSLNDLSNPTSVAISLDSTELYVANNGDDYVSVFYTPTGATAGAAVASYDLNAGTGLEDAELDGSGDVWVTTNMPALVELPGGGGPPVVSTTSEAYLSTPIGIALEPGAAGDVWIANSGANYASLFTNAGVAVTAGGTDEYKGNGTNDVDDPIGLAIDQNGSVWLANSNGTISELSSDGTKVKNSSFSTGTATSANDGIAIGGGDDLWITNPAAGTIYHVTTNSGSPVSPPGGYSAVLGSPDGIAMDGSGSIWYTSSSTADLYEVVGAALPVVTPLSVAVEDSRLGQEPTAKIP